MCLGAALLISALLLFLSNKREEMRAESAVEEILPKVIYTIRHPSADPIRDPIRDPEVSSIADPFDPTMKEVEIDGYFYIGYLTVPSLELELPVMASWDMERMKLAPCRYFGSTKSDDLVIAGHNYARHFKRLEKLTVGDLIQFTDMNGEVTVYQVYEMETLPPTAVEEMVAGEAALTLFTCTYSGQARITIRCERFEAA